MAEPTSSAQIWVPRNWVGLASSFHGTQASRALFDLSVRNIGHCPAIYVRVHLDPPPKRARETHNEFAIANINMPSEPIALIAPGQEMRVIWDSHIERNGVDALPTIHHVTITYEDTSGHPYGPEKSVIDLEVVESRLKATADSHYECSCLAPDMNCGLSHPRLSQEHSLFRPTNSVGGSRLSGRRGRRLLSPCRRREGPAPRRSSGADTATASDPPAASCAAWASPADGRPRPSGVDTAQSCT